MINLLITLRALSPVHCGTGQGFNDIDLPTARNSISGHPVIPASSLKGVIKDEFLNNGLGENTGNTEWEKISITLFGESNDFESAISIGDANLLALPVRSFFGTFAYIASPYTLQQLKTIFKRMGNSQSSIALPEIPTIGLTEDNGNYKVMITSQSCLKNGGYNCVLLEEMDLLIDNRSDIADQWSEIIAPLFFNDTEGQALFKKRFAIVDDNALNFFCDCGLPVDPHIKIDDKTGTVQNGALWYEESVPPECLFTGITGVDRSYNSNCKISASELADFLMSPGTIYCQVGGKSTTGKGFVAVGFKDSPVTPEGA